MALAKKGNRRKGEGDDDGTKAWGIILQVCQGNSTLMKYLIYLPTIGRICFKENHHVNSLDLNGPKINAIYLVEF